MVSQNVIFSNNLFELLHVDPPRGEEYWIPIDPQFQHASDLVAYIKGTPEFASYFCVGVAGKLLEP